MVFTLLIAADLHQTKVNYEVEFPGGAPTLAELQRRVEEVHGAEYQQRRPATVPQAPFNIERIQVFDERVELWVDLLSSTQLEDFSQLYVFQPETAWHREVQSKLPPATRQPSARPPVAPLPQQPTRSPSPSVPQPGGSYGRPHVVLPLPAVPAPPPVPSPAAAMLPPAPRRPASAVRSLQEPRLMLPDLPREEKVFSIFSVFDARGARAVDQDSFRQALQRLRVEISAASVSDLFVRADADRDGALSLAEFQVFAERYPTLIDALHYRIREGAIDQKQQDAIAAARQALEQLRRAEADSRQEVADAGSDVAAQEMRLSAAQHQVADSEGREGDCAAAVDAAQQESLRLRQDAVARANEVQQVREQERQRQAQHLDACREVEGSEQRVAVQDQQVRLAEDKLREIERLLNDQRREVDTQREHAQRLREVVAQAQNREHGCAMAVQEIQRDAQAAADRAAAAEQDLVRSQERERETVAAHAATRDDVAQRRQQRDHEERQLAAVRDHEQRKKAQEQEVGSACASQEGLCMRLEQENREHNQQRLRVEDEERPLIEQEVRLREARDSLEEKEAQLRNDCGTFAQRTTGRGVVPAGSPVRAPVRVPHEHPPAIVDPEVTFHNGVPVHPAAARFLAAAQQPPPPQHVTMRGMSPY